MNLFEEPESTKDIDFGEIESQYQEIIKPYFCEQSCDPIPLIGQLIKIEKDIIDKNG
ncbi:MAG: hypothetical protein K9H64_11205 [Bacteroidales bacterium]|nr:hypothetical protein [Bacteroidales bacterium]MCF8456518.1 hypothetical protein [Bacteroidales bacterium]